MSILAFLNELRAQGIELWVEGDRLRYRAPQGRLTPALHAELGTHKAEILAFLGEVAQEGPPISPVSRQRPLPLSFAQERLWFLDQLKPDSPVYNVPMALRLTGTLDVRALAESLNEIVRRHESLRTSFSTVDGRAVQVISPSLNLPLPVNDLRRLPHDEREPLARQVANEEGWRPFALAAGPLVRARLLRLGDEEHILLVTMHHIVSDGWSMGVFFRELSTLYEAFVCGDPSPLPDLGIQYADFAVWQREWLRGEVLERQLTYWKEQLADAPALLDLPTDRARAAVPSYRGGRRSVVLPRGLAESLKDLSRDEGVTLFMTLLAAFDILLYRYTGQEDVVVGTPIANRTRVETEGLIGFFVNTLVLRSDLSGNPTFRDLLKRVRDVCLEAYQHQDLPFERLVQELQPERSMSYAPVFQVMFAYENAPRHALSLPGLTVSRMSVESGTAKFDLGVGVAEAEGGLRAVFSCNADLFDGATIERMMGHYETLLEGIVTGPDERIGYLPLLTEGERHQILMEWNATEAEHPEDLCIHHMFEAQVERTPAAVAVKFEDQHLTYRQLNTHANQLAHYLRKQGVGPEVLVGMCMEHCLEAVVAILGMLKAGAAYVPLDPAYPLERLHYMIEDSGVNTVVTLDSLAGRVMSAGAQDCLVLDLGNTAPDIAAQPSMNLHPQGLGPDDLAYVIYTSGTAGHPKGVVVQHCGVVNQVWYRSSGVLREEARRSMALHSSFSFDGSVSQIFTPLAVGGTVHVVPDLMELGRLVRSGTLSYIGLTPSSLEALMTSMDLPDHVTTVAVGGENVGEHLVKRVRNRSKVKRMLNFYGPTEATITCTDGPLIDRTPNAYEPSRRGMADYRSTPVTIGRPMPNMRAYILGQDLEPNPVGVVGELHVGGIGLARGYLNRPDLTADRFIPDPFSANRGARLYKTGDLGRYLPDGRIELRGRLDTQVKVRGFRIELKAIEAVLERNPAIRRAVTLTRDLAPVQSSPRRMDTVLVAYVLPQREARPRSQELRRFVAERLPDYMVPSFVVILDELPLMPNGKVDREALPMPEAVRRDPETAFQAPRTPLETTIARVWKEALGVERVGLYDNFFDLGGHSLLAMQVIAALEGELGVQFHPRDLVFQTLGQLASAATDRISAKRRSQSKGSFREVLHAITNAIGRSDD